MARGADATFAQIQGLLSGKILASARGLPSSLLDHTALCRGDRDSVPEEVGQAFVLEHTGSEDDPGSPRGYNEITQFELFDVTLSVQAGGGEGGTGDHANAPSVLAVLTTRVVDLLMDPNNGDRDITGWWWTKPVKPGKNRLINGRLHKTLPLSCCVAHDAGAF